MTAERVLLHVCCGPCAVYPLKVLQEEGYEVHGLWFNPNIHPFTEYLKRLEAAREYFRSQDVPLIELDEYSLVEFLRDSAYRENGRCPNCYSKRLEKAAGIARKGKFDYFTTTLLYSKMQRHDLIREMGLSAARGYGRKFLYRDFREGWKYGIEKSREAGMYRQQYCGCIYSEMERYRGKLGDN